MTVNPYWPLVSWQAAFNVGANDPVTTLSWTELVSRLWSWDGGYGRQYEADVNQAGEAEATLDDLDENLNPANGSSPFAPGVVPYRQFLHQVMWPPVPVGSAVNMLNTTSGYDVGFGATTVGTTPSWITAVGGTTPLVGTTTPRSAPNDLGWSVVNGATAQGAQITPVACIPGQQYTASGYIRQSSASTQQISIVGGATGTSTATTGAYVRLSVTFTATQPTHAIQFATTGTAVAGAVLLDDIQLEPGASSSTFSSAIGPVVYGIARGLVERWPSGWDYNGIRGRCDLTCVDALAALAQIPMHTDYVNTVLGLDPDYYWWLADAEGSAVFGDISGNGRPSLQEIVGSKSGGGDGLQPGTTMNIVGDPGGTGVHFPPPNPGMTVLAVGNAVHVVSSAGTFAFPPAIGTSWAATAAAWVTLQSDSIGWIASVLGPSNANLSTSPQNFVSPISIGYISGSFTCEIDNFPLGASNSANANFAITAPGVPHLVVGTVSQANGGNTVVKIYVDGTLRTTTTVTTASLGGMIYTQGTYLIVGGDTDRTGAVGGPLTDADVAHVALWSRALSASEITSLWTAGGQGFAGETSGARISRMLGYVYNGLTSIDTGASVMSAGTVTEGATALDACQFVETSENGDFWADGTGTLQFRGRQARYYNTTPDWTFGENAAGGEAPYEQGITFDFDPTLIGNQVTITQTNGVVIPVTDPTSIKAYFPHLFDREIGVSSVLEVYDAANWFLATRKDPKQRVANIQLHPSANPALWPVALGVRKGDRITVKRRTSAGLTMTIDFFCEQVEHAHSPGDWLTSFQLSPVMGQPWILDDPTWSVLNVTTVLGY